MNNIIKRKLRIHCGKNWYNKYDIFQYTINFPPNVELIYDSVLCEDNPESPQLIIQWLIWYISIWFEKER